MKKPSPYPLISWAMDLKLTPALNSIRDRHAQAAAVPAAAVDDGLKVGDNKKATSGGVAFFYDGGVHRLRKVQRSKVLGFSSAAGMKKLSAEGGQID